MKREEVYRVIDRERDHQDSLGRERVDGHTHTVGEEILLLQSYANKAAEAWVNFPGDDVAKIAMAKVAAIAVRCLENHAE